MSTPEDRARDRRAREKRERARRMEAYMDGVELAVEFIGDALHRKLCGCGALPEECFDTGRDTGAGWPKRAFGEAVEGLTALTSEMQRVAATQQITIVIPYIPEVLRRARRWKGEDE